MDFLEHFIRQDLSVKAPVIMGVIDPIKVVIENLPEGYVEYVEGENHPKDESFGKRNIAFTKELYIDREDFEEVYPGKSWKRWSLDIEVRLRHAYFVKANRVEKDANGKVTTIYATYDVATKSGSGFNERKPNGTIHFVSATHNVPVTFNIINPLILGEVDKSSFLESINPESLVVKQGFVEDTLNTTPNTHYQLIRQGYYVIDKDSTNNNVVLNRTVSLKESK